MLKKIEYQRNGMMYCKGQSEPQTLLLSTRVHPLLSNEIHGSKRNMLYNTQYCKAYFLKQLRALENGILKKWNIKKMEYHKNRIM